MALDRGCMILKLGGGQTSLIEESMQYVIVGTPFLLHSESRHFFSVF